MASKLGRMRCTQTGQDSERIDMLAFVECVRCARAINWHVLSSREGIIGDHEQMEAWACPVRPWINAGGWTEAFQHAARSSEMWRKMLRTFSGTVRLKTQKSHFEDRVA